MDLASAWSCKTDHVAERELDEPTFDAVFAGSVLPSYLSRSSLWFELQPFKLIQRLAGTMELRITLHI